MDVLSRASRYVAPVAELQQNQSVMTVRRHGTCVAILRGMRAVACLAGFAVMTMGCLVTEKTDFAEEPNLPPSIISPPGARNPPIRIATFVVGSATPGVDAGVGANELLYEASIRDPN